MAMDPVDNLINIFSNDNKIFFLIKKLIIDRLGVVFEIRFTLLIICEISSNRHLLLNHAIHERSSSDPENDTISGSR